MYGTQLTGPAVLALAENVICVQAQETEVLLARLGAHHHICGYLSHCVEVEHTDAGVHIRGAFVLDLLVAIC